jgi:hypothetical protein
MVKKAWAGYAGLLTLLVVAGEIVNLAGGGTVEPRTVANWLVTAVLLVATWGYALQRPIGALYYWRAACWVVLAASLITTVPALLSGDAARLMVAVLLPLVVPAFVASFLYAYRSPDLWRGRESAP